uniref:Strictosidine synthase conserved region domain-containing protein n=1 Tax=Phlebotomus papatasi TaxID=29031 RepID=A0A1B0D711_PHLPP
MFFVRMSIILIVIASWKLSRSPFWGNTPTTTTPRPTTTTSKPTTTAPPPKPTTTTPPPTTTTTPKPTTTTTTTTPKPTTTTPPPTKAPPKTTEAPPKQTIPIHEDIPSDTKPPPAPKLKVIKKGEEFIVVAETGASRLRKYYLKGERKGTWQVFLDNLPGHPDNLSPAEDGFWVPLVAPSDKENPSLLGSLAKVPLVRKFLLRLVYLIQTPFRLISNAVPNVYTQKIYHAIGHFETSNWLFGPRVTILKVDWTGKIVAALHGTDGQLGGICHLLQVGEHYYLGSPFSKYMGRVKVPQHLMSKKESLRVFLQCDDVCFGFCRVGQPAELQGVLELNGYLNEGERLLEGRVHGPEHLLAVGGSIYTGIQGGEVIRINGDHITHVAKFGAPCEGAYEEAKCGRPLGMSLDVKKDHLIVADAFYGIWQVNLVNGKKQLLVSMNQEVKGTTPRRPKIANSVAVHSSGDIYWTDSCSDFGLDDGMFTMLANPAGRLIHYDRARNVSTTLIDEMLFAIFRITPCTL